jgi:hypothetical protein
MVRNLQDGRGEASWGTGGVWRRERVEEARTSNADAAENVTVAELVRHGRPDRRPNLGNNLIEGLIEVATIESGEVGPQGNFRVGRAAATVEREARRDHQANAREQ